MNFNEVKYKVALLLAMASMCWACQKEVPQRDIEAEILHYMEVYDLPSLSAAVIKGDEVVWQVAYGYADIYDKEPVNMESIYHIASISKLFIATAIMQLEEQGKVNLDSDINFYLPVDIRNPYYPETPITLRMLMTHTAGIAWPQYYIEAKDLWEHFPPDSAPYPSEWVPQFLVPDGEQYNHWLWKNTEPGSFEYYSNVGSNVVAYVVEQVSGLDFRTYCKENIFLPLGMNNSSFNVFDLEYEKIVQLYLPNNVSIGFYDDRLFASGGMKTSVTDLSNFLRAYLNKGTYQGFNLLKPETINKMMELHNPTSGTCLLWHASVGGWYGHTGGTETVATSTDLHPDDQLAIIVFTNKHNSTVYPGHEIYGLVRQKANDYRY